MLTGKILAVVNPLSGGTDKSSFYEALETFLDSVDYTHTVYKTTGEDDRERILELLEEQQPDIVIAAGGDGTSTLVASILVNRPERLLIVPLGSANGMATELNIPGQANKALELIKSGAERAIDILRINGHFSLHLADVGFNARIVKRFEQDKKRGLFVYARHLFRELFLIKVYRFDILCDGKPLKRKAVSLTFANSSKYGTGAVINPVGELDDGKFELCIVKPFPRYYLPVIAVKFFAGNVHESDYMEIISCREATITCSRKTTLQIDGEVIGKTKQIKLEMFSRAVKTIVP